jgi:hypothetical protein
MAPFMRLLGADSVTSRVSTRTGCGGRAIVATMEIDFWHDGDQGRVTVTCVPNDDPAAVGKGEEARGFPACTATIAYPGRGYRALFG